MKLDFIDISRADEYERGSTVPSSSGNITPKSREKINTSVFLDVEENPKENRKIREIDSIDVSRDRSERRGTRERRRPESGERRSVSGRRASVGEEINFDGTGNRSADRNRTPGRNRSADRDRTSDRSRNAKNAATRRKREAELRARQEREQRRKRRQRKQMAAKASVLLFMVSFVGLLLFALIKIVDGNQEGAETVSRIDEVFTQSVQRREIIKENQTQKPVIEENFLTLNEYSRPGEKLEKVNNIFVHYTANKGTSAAQNRSYFENLGITGETSASAHFIIGFDGEIIQCVPLEEIAYAVQKRNYDSISIECCYLQDNGEFTEATYQSLIHLCGWLLNEYDLAPEDMRRHYDEGGKKCPLYYVEHEEAWEQFLQDLNNYIMTKGQEDI